MGPPGSLICQWHMCCVQELEANLADISGAMAAMQRSLDERAQQMTLLTEEAQTNAAEAATFRAQLSQIG